MQVDYLHSEASSDQLDPATGAPLNQDRFYLRRVRPRVDINKGLLSGVVQIDVNTVNGAQVRPWDVEVGLHWPAHQADVPLIGASMGLMLIPFGFEVQQSDTDRLFLERSNVEHAFWYGEHDLGARLYGGWRFLRYQIAIMNGNPIGAAAFPLIDPSSFKDVVGRLGIDTSIVPGLRIFGGFSADKGMGFHAGTSATKPTIVWHDLNDDGQVQVNEITVIPGQAALPSMDFSRFAVAGDLGITVKIPVLGDLKVYAELESGTNMDRSLFPADPVLLARDLLEFGYYVAFTQQLTKWATIGLRYDYYQPDQNAFSEKVQNVAPRDASVSTLAAAAALQYGAGRLILEYDHNTNHYGLTTAGVPTNLPSDQLGLRVELKL